MTEATVVICTRNRPSHLLRAVRSVLASGGVDLELIVMDQSDDDATKLVLDTVLDTRLRYVTSRRPGKGAAMNEAVALAGSSIIVFTDDDCEVPRDWIQGMVALFQRFPEAGAVFSRVVDAPHDKGAGYIPTFLCRGTRVMRSVGETILRGRGIGAGMAWKREALVELGGADELLGPGSHFKACDDWDLELRALLAGWPSVHSGDLCVVHHGFRRHEDGASHARDTWTGIGASLGKLVRAGKASVLVLAIWESFAHALLPPAIDLLRLRRPRGLARIKGFAQGFRDGFAAGIDRSTLTFTACGAHEEDPDLIATRSVRATRAPLMRCRAIPGSK